MIIHYSDVHLDLLIRVADDSELALVYVDIGVFFERELEEVYLRIVARGVYLA